MKRSKILIGFSIFAILTLFCGCASKDDGVKEVVFDSEDKAEPEEEVPEEEQEITEDNTILVTSDDASSVQIEAVAPASRNKKNYTGWIAVSIKPISNTVGNITINTRPKKGTFSIAVTNKNEKQVPVLSTSNEYMTTSFYLKAGRKIIKLCDDSSVVSAAKKTDKGIKLRYSMDKVGIVIIDFECFSSIEGEPEDSIKVTAEVLSQSHKKTDFQLKLIMDTILGETDRHHFYTSENLPVKNEVVYHSMTEEKWFVSRNAKAAMQIILDGGESTPVESVALANFTTLDTKKWEADMTTFRSFDTVLSYNNSAVGIYWPKVALQPEEACKSVFYLSFATDDAVPAGADFIRAQDEAELEAQKAAEESEEPEEETAPVEEEKPVEENTVQNIEAVAEPVKQPETKPAPEKITPEKTAQEPVAEPEEVKEPENVAAVEEKPASTNSGISEDKLKADYIQKLLDRIEELEEGDPELNKKEINELNTELDAIITILNSRNQ